MIDRNTNFSVPLIKTYHQFVWRLSRLLIKKTSVVVSFNRPMSYVPTRVDSWAEKKLPSARKSFFFLPSSGLEGEDILYQSRKSASFALFLDLSSRVAVAYYYPASKHFGEDLQVAYNSISFTANFGIALFKFSLTFHRRAVSIQAFLGRQNDQQVVKFDKLIYRILVFDETSWAMLSRISWCLILQWPYNQC